MVNGNVLMFKKSSSSGGAIFAAITVTYPSGSTCIATNGTTILTASDTAGTYIFGIPTPASTPETWTVSCTDGTDSLSETVSITECGQIEEIVLSSIPTSVNDATWAQISEVSITGTGDTYWDIGDRKAVTLNGTVGALSINNVTLYVYILDFNHPINKTMADNNIIWGGFKTALTGGVDVALCDSKQGGSSTNGTKYNNMNHWGAYNYGGWKGSDFRYDVLGGTSTQPSDYGSAKTSSATGYDATQTTITTPVTNTLMAALPSELRSSLRLWNRYIDSKGNKSNTDSNCSTPTVDAISMLAEFEIYGIRNRANQYEQNHQKQMTYYSNGNPKIKYQHNATNTACIWLMPSAHYNTNSSFCTGQKDGSSASNTAYYSLAISPAFRT